MTRPLRRSLCPSASARRDMDLPLLCGLSRAAGGYSPHGFDTFPVALTFSVLAAVMSEQLTGAA